MREDTIMQVDTYTTIGEFLKEKVSYHIPLLQRNYAWESGKDAWVGKEPKPGKRNTAHNLIYEIIDNYQKNKIMILGLVTLYKNGDQIQIIDGQQRMITLTLILKVLGGTYNARLIFERDYQDCPVRSNFLYDLEQNTVIESVDVKRMQENLTEIKKVLEYYQIESKKELVDYIFNSVKIIKYETMTEPLDEFFNINSYKTPFSIVDYLRGQLLRNIENISENHKQAVNELYFRLKQISKLLYYPDSANVLWLGAFKKGYGIEDGSRNRLDILFIDRYMEGGSIDAGYIERTYHDYYHNDSKFSELKILELYHRALKEFYEQWNCGLDQMKNVLELLLPGGKYLGIYNFSKTEEYPLNDIERIEDYPHISTLLYHKAKDQGVRNCYAQSFFGVPVSKRYDPFNAENLFLILEEAVDRYGQEMKAISMRDILPYAIPCNESKGVPAEGGQAPERENRVTSLQELFMREDIKCIKIPKLQRDYIQGCAPESFIAAMNKEATEESFTASCIIGHIDDKKTLWIYDGQQRMTTFVCIMAKLLKKNPDAEWKKLLQKFSFDSRDEANNALESMITKDEPEISVCDLTTYSLQQIWSKLQKSNLPRKTSDAFARFIQFQFVTIGERSEAEQLFMDLNSGQPLTEQDIYKSKLMAQLNALYQSTTTEELKKEIKNAMMKLDNDWLDKYKSEENEFACLQFYFHCTYNERYHDKIVPSREIQRNNTDPTKILDWVTEDKITKGFLQTVSSAMEDDEDRKYYSKWIEFRMDKAKQDGVMFPPVMEITKKDNEIYFRFTEEGKDNPFKDKFSQGSLSALKLAYDIYYLDEQKKEHQVKTQAKQGDKLTIDKIYDVTDKESTSYDEHDLICKLNKRLDIKEFYDTTIWDSKTEKLNSTSLNLKVEF